MNKDNYVMINKNFLVVLDSRNASIKYNGPSNSSINFDFQDSIRRDDDCVSMQCSVLNFSFPYSIHIINNNNDTLIINNFPYTITNGNYNALTFMTTFNNTLTGYNLTLNTATNKFTRADINSTNFTIQGSIMSTIGGTTGSTYSSTLYSFTFPYLCDFNGLNSLNI